MRDDDLLPAWQTVIDVASTGIASRLTLVGGLMVAAHARRAGVRMMRPTDDMDALVDYWTHRHGLTEARVALHSIGFDLIDGGKHAYRFQHADGRKLDLMVADHLPSQMRPRLAGRNALAVPAGAQAIRRRAEWALTFGGGAQVVLGVPDVLGALVVKGAAFLIDPRDRGRHLDDAAVLLACVDDASVFDYEAMSRNDRRRLSALIEQVGDASHPSWVSLEMGSRSQGLFNAHLIQSMLA